MSQNKKLSVILVIVIVLAVLMVGYTKFGLSFLPGSHSQNLVTKKIDPNLKFQPETAASGQLIPGFPQSLVLDKYAQILSSYKTTLAASQSSYVATFSSVQDIGPIYNTYLDYLNKQNFQIKEQVLNAKDGHIYSQLNGLSTNIVFKSSIQPGATVYTITTIELNK
ncbi:MAG: hypothetical protein ACHQF4_02080 [Sphingobacteriales bacterium]